MKMFRERSPHTECTLRNRQLSVAKKTEGWSKLSNWQQKIIEHSLYIQARVRRGAIQTVKEFPELKFNIYYDDPDTIPKRRLLEYKRTDDIDWQEQELYREGEPTKEELDSLTSVYPKPEDRPYAKSEQHMEKWYCHAAVDSLERGKTLTEEPDTNEPSDFFEGESVVTDDYLEIKKHIEQCAFPCVVHIKDNKDEFDKGMFGVLHTFLVLGHKDDNLIIWEKSGPQLPYNITTLHEIVDRYAVKGTMREKYPFAWAVREVRK